MFGFNYNFNFTQIIGLIVLTISSYFLDFSVVKAQNINNQQVQGKTGGDVNSGDCGYIGNQPNHVINLGQPVYSLKIKLEATEGNPSLLILGPSNSDRFCILGEPNTGKLPEMSGVWEAGKYLIYVGDIQGKQHPFILNISVN